MPRESLSCENSLLSDLGVEIWDELVILLHKGSFIFEDAFLLPVPEPFVNWLVLEPCLLADLVDLLPIPLLVRLVEFLEDINGLLSVSDGVKVLAGSFIIFFSTWLAFNRCNNIIFLGVAGTLNIVLGSHRLVAGLSGGKELKIDMQALLSSLGWNWDLKLGLSLLNSTFGLSV
jgi:hypothetical protein